MVGQTEPDRIWLQTLPIQVEAIAWRVKRSLLLHYLTCGIYSKHRSGGNQGLWRDLFLSLTSCLRPRDHDPLDCRSSGSCTPCKS